MLSAPMLKLHIDLRRYRSTGRHRAHWGFRTDRSFTYCVMIPIAGWVSAPLGLPSPPAARIVEIGEDAIFIGHGVCLSIWVTGIAPDA